MAFQDYAESLRARLHVSSVPTPVFVGIGILFVIFIVVGVCSMVILTSSSGGFEIQQAGTEEGDTSQSSSTEDNAAASDELVAQDGSQTDSATSSSQVQVCVHVDGAVAHPGVYYVNAGSRLVDVVEAAGGLQSDAATTAVNLAQEVQDGQHIVVPTESEVESGQVSSEIAVTSSSSVSSVGSSSASSNGLININTATASELTALPGVGEATAEKIVADREKNGAFKSLEDLKRVSGIGDKKYEALKDQICL